MPIHIFSMDLLEWNTRMTWHCVRVSRVFMRKGQHRHGKNKFFSFPYVAPATILPSVVLYITSQSHEFQHVLHYIIIIISLLFTSVAKTDIISNTFPDFHVYPVSSKERLRSISWTKSSISVFVTCYIPKYLRTLPHHTLLKMQMSPLPWICYWIGWKHICISANESVSWMTKVHISSCDAAPPRG